MSFSRLTYTQCTRRLGHLAHSARTFNNPGKPQVIPTVPAYIATAYITTASPPPPASRNRSSQKKPQVERSRDSLTKPRFARADIPPLEFWDLYARAPMVTDLSAQECLETAEAYVDAALRNAPGWREKRITTNDIPATQPPDGSPVVRGMAPAPDLDRTKPKILSAYTLHYVAVMIVSGRLGQSSPALHLAVHILHTLTSLDYAPSIITLVRIALQRRLLGKPQYALAFERLERLLRRIDSKGGGGGDDKSTNKHSEANLAADAYTLRALIYAADDTREGDDNALRWFRRAYEIDAAASKERAQATPPSSQDAGETEGVRFNPHWQWKVSFALGVAAIRAKRGELGKARDMCEMAASELDNEKGYLEMAKVLERMGEAHTDKYVNSLEQAAASGVQEAMRKMATREWARSEEGGLSKQEKRRRQIVAEEWMLVAGASVDMYD
ncbi:hypothetical protein F4825DRAFT_441176 [Nemania diffusa]|nr:hypothetical protein F4825DRAFT_441176 [Nemania diffusa]